MADNGVHKESDASADDPELFEYELKESVERARQNPATLEAWRTHDRPRFIRRASKLGVDFGTLAGKAWRS